MVRQLTELLDANAGMAEYLDRCPGPKGPVLFEGEVVPACAARLFGPDAARRLCPHRRPTKGLAPRAEKLPFCGTLRRGEQRA